MITHGHWCRKDLCERVTELLKASQFNRKTEDQEKKSIKILEQSCFGNVDNDADVDVNVGLERDDLECLECDQKFR